MLIGFASPTSACNCDTIALSWYWSMAQNLIPEVEWHILVRWLILGTDCAPFLCYLSNARSAWRKLLYIGETNTLREYGIPNNYFGRTEISTKISCHIVTPSNGDGFEKEASYVIWKLLTKLWLVLRINFKLSSRTDSSTTTDRGHAYCSAK